MKRKCPICGIQFEKQRMGQKVCSARCSLEYVKQQSDKADRKLTKEKKDALKTRSEWLKEAQQAFNAYIRARDGANGYPCISCGRHHAGDNHAGHYRSVGAAPHLRFDEDNVHLQCQPCNTHKHGNVVEYRIRLIQRIGLARVERLESDSSVKKYTIEDAKRIKSEYKQKLIDLRRNHEATE
jgi:hypothetical protein